MAPKTCLDKTYQPRELLFKLITVWQLNGKHAAVQRHPLTFPWTRNLQIADMFQAIGALYPNWKRDQCRMYGRCGELYLPIKDYVTLTATLRHMNNYGSEVLYLVRTDIKDESLMTVEELQIRWHVKEAEQQENDIKLIRKWVGDKGYEGRTPYIRGEHAPASERIPPDLIPKDEKLEIPKRMRKSVRKKK